MREDNLLCLRKRSFVGTTDSNHSFPVYPNLAKDKVVTDINQLWVSDITYIRLLSEFVYLAVILDVFSRKCIGWELDRFLDTRLTLNALHKALDARWTPELKGLVHHSDQGVQYASSEYINCLKEHNIHVSMCRKGNPFENAFAESFIKTLKWEEVYLFEYETFNEAYIRIHNFIEDVYNEKRIHSSIEYLTPNEFEMGLILQIHA
jgi:transposase InsO family protein